MAGLPEALFDEAWRLCESAFPVMERRELSLHRQLLNHPLYRPDVAVSEGRVVGLLFSWNFGSCRFVEHLAVDAQRRGNGLGRRMMHEYLSRGAGPVVLEVELPTDDESRRRIGFYQRLGFMLNDFDYRQLPMRRGGVWVDLKVMSAPGLLTESQFAAWKAEFRATCFDPYLADAFRFA